MTLCRGGLIVNEAAEPYSVVTQVWYMPIVSVLRRLRQEDGKFEISLCCTELYVSKIKCEFVQALDRREKMC